MEDTLSGSGFDLDGNTVSGRPGSISSTGSVGDLGSLGVDMMSPASRASGGSHKKLQEMKEKHMKCMQVLRTASGGTSNPGRQRSADSTGSSDLNGLKAGLNNILRQLSDRVEEEGSESGAVVHKDLGKALKDIQDNHQNSSQEVLQSVSTLHQYTEKAFEIVVESLQMNTDLLDKLQAANTHVELKKVREALEMIDKLGASRTHEVHVAMDKVKQETTVALTQMKQAVSQLEDRLQAAGAADREHLVEHHSRSSSSLEAGVSTLKEKHDDMLAGVSTIQEKVQAAETRHGELGDSLQACLGKLDEVRGQSTEANAQIASLVKQLAATQRMAEEAQQAAATAQKTAEIMQMSLQEGRREQLKELQELRQGLALQAQYDGVRQELALSKEQAAAKDAATKTAENHWEGERERLNEELKRLSQELDTRDTSTRVLAIPGQGALVPFTVANLKRQARLQAQHRPRCFWLTGALITVVVALLVGSVIRARRPEPRAVKAAPPRPVKGFPLLRGNKKPKSRRR